MKRERHQERIRVHIDSGGIDAVGPKEIAKAFEGKETAMVKRGSGFVEANWSGIKTMERRRSSDTRKMAKKPV